MDGQVSGLGTVHPILTLSFLSTWILPLHVVCSLSCFATKPFGDGAMDHGGRIQIELAASSSRSVCRRPCSGVR